MGFDTDLKDLGADVRGLSASLRAEGTPFDFSSAGLALCR